MRGLAAWAGVAWLFTASVASAAEFHALRVSGGPESTRVVFELDARVRHRVFMLENPHRLVVDLRGLSPASVAQAGLEGLAGAAGVVKGVRSAPRHDGSLRFVLDLAGPVKTQNFQLAPSEGQGFRLVFDLYGGTPSIAEPRPATSAPVASAERTPDSSPVIAASSAPTRAPTAASVSPVFPSTPPVWLADKPIVIAIDAGHGGDDPGARGRGGLLEKDVSLSLSRRLAKLVDQQRGLEAVLTRDGDYYIGLRERVERARQAQADLFVSVHANAYKDRKLRGSAVYVLSPRGATSEHARWLARKENSADLVGGIELSDKDNELAAVLIDLSQSSTMEASFDVGSRMLSSLGKINRLQRTEVQQAGFMVLKAPDIPSVLVETAFITNDHEEKLLRDPAYQDKIARSLLEGIQGYFADYRPQQMMIQASTELAPSAAAAAGPVATAYSTVPAAVSAH